MTSSWVYLCMQALTHWGRVTHICVSKLTIIGSDNGLSPDRHQAIIWTNAGILLIGLLGTNFSEILIEILTFSYKKMRLKVSSAKRGTFCLGLNVLKVRVLWQWSGHCDNVYASGSVPFLHTALDIQCMIMWPKCNSLELIHLAKFQAVLYHWRH